MIVSLSVVGVAFLTQILAVMFLPVAPERRRASRTALTSAVIVTAAGVALMTALFLAAAASGNPILETASKIPLMAAFALLPIGALSAVVFGMLGLGWPTLFDRPNDRFAANLYAMIAGGILVICIAGAKHLHDDWPGYLIALFSIPLVPMLTKKRLGPLLTRGIKLDRRPKGEWAQPMIVARKEKPVSQSVAIESASAPRVLARLSERGKALVARVPKPAANAPAEKPQANGAHAVQPAAKATQAAKAAAAKTVQQPAARPSTSRAVVPTTAKAVVKRDITAIEVPSEKPTAAVPAGRKTKAKPVANVAASPRRPARPAASAAPRPAKVEASPKRPTTLIIPEDPNAKPAAEVVVIHPKPKIEHIEEIPEQPPAWTNLVVGNITLEDGRSYSIAIRSTQTIGEKDIRKLAKAG